MPLPNIIGGDWHKMISLIVALLFFENIKVYLNIYAGYKRR